MRDMKDSGLGYLGEIPAHWNTERIKNHLHFSPDKNPGGATILSLYRELGIVPKDSRADNHNVTSEDTSNYRYVRVGDFVVNKMKAWQGSMGVSAYEGVVSPAYYVYRFTTDAFDKKYLHYLLRSKCYADEFRRLSGGIRIGQWDLPKVGFETTYVAIPPKAEQSAIAETIDIQLNKVDTLIANVRAQIAKLKAYKQSVISEVVTKGLETTVPMKNSGLMWIGQIPTHWSISKVSMFYEVVLGKMLQPEKKEETDTFENYLCAANVGNNSMKIDLLKQMWFSEKDKQQYCVRKGDLIVVEGGDVASCDIIRFDVQNLYIQNALHRVRAKKESLLEFLRYYLMMAKGQGYVNLICNKATIAHFTKDKFMSLPLLVVPVDEQREIVKYLDQKCDQIDRLIAIKQKKIEKLEQYKRSLIYEYVTGKKEVS